MNVINQVLTLIHLVNVNQQQQCLSWCCLCSRKSSLKLKLKGRRNRQRAGLKDRRIGWIKSRPPYHPRHRLPAPRPPTLQWRTHQTSTTHKKSTLSTSSMLSWSSCRPERLRWVFRDLCSDRLSAADTERVCVVRQAYQLIRAVSVLLHFTREEEDMLKQTLEYKVVVSLILYLLFGIIERLSN